MKTNITDLKILKKLSPAKFFSYHFEHISARVRVTGNDFIVEFEGDEKNFCWFECLADAVTFINFHNSQHFELLEDAINFIKSNESRESYRYYLLQDLYKYSK